MQRCTRNDCRRAGDDIAECNDASVIGCGNLVEIDPAKDVTLKCSTHDRTFSVPAADLLKGTAKFPKCGGMDGACKVLSIKPKA